MHLLQFPCYQTSPYRLRIEKRQNHHNQDKNSIRKTFTASEKH
jgi:hypothetical protein